MPMANRGGTDIRAQLALLPQVAEEFGRSLDGFEVTVFIAPLDAEVLADLAQAGVNRVVFSVGERDWAAAKDLVTEISAVAGRAGLAFDGADS